MSNKEMGSSVKHRHFPGAKNRLDEASRKGDIVLRAYPTLIMEGQHDVLLSSKDVADILGVSDQYIRDKGCTFLPSVKIGRYRRFKLSDLLELIKKSGESVHPDRDKKHAEQKADEDVSCAEQP